MFCTKCGKTIRGEKFGLCEACGGEPSEVPLELSQPESAAAALPSSPGPSSPGPSSPVATNSNNARARLGGSYCIRRVSPLSAGVTLAVFQTLFCLLILPMVALPVMFGLVHGKDQIALALLPVGVGVFFLIQVVMAFFMGVLASTIYNLVAKITGGIEIKLTPQ